MVIIILSIISSRLLFTFILILFFIFKFLNYQFIKHKSKINFKSYGQLIEILLV